MEKIINFRGENVKRVNYFIPICMEHVLASYGRTIGKDFIKAFCGEWDFEFEEYDIDKVLKVADCIKHEEILMKEYDKYNGVHIEYKKVYDRNDLIEVIEQNTDKGIPTLIHMDTFYSFWGILYNKVHSNHIAVVVGIDKEDKKIWIVDPDFSYKAFEVDYELIEKASMFYLDIIVQNINKYSYDELIDILCEKKYYYQKQFEYIEKFAEYFSKNFNPLIEFGENPNIDSVLDSRLISEIRNIIKGRNLFIVFLEQIVSKYNYIENVIEYMYISIGKWNTIMNLLFKAASTKWIQELNEKIKVIILSIAETEKQAYRWLCESRNFKMKQKEISTKHNRRLQSINIDIKSQCNNKGFTFENRTTCNCDLTNVGEYIILFETFNIIKINEVYFNTYFKYDMDNIVCKGQKIDISNIDNIYSLELLLCAEWGTCEDSVVFTLDNGDLFARRIVANDISKIEVENIIKIGCSKNKKGDIINEKVGITYNQIIIDNKQKVISFNLPVNPNMHVIAVSVLVDN